MLVGVLSSRDAEVNSITTVITDCTIIRTQKHARLKPCKHGRVPGLA